MWHQASERRSGYFSDFHSGCHQIRKAWPHACEFQLHELCIQLERPAGNAMGAWAEDTFGNDAACDWAGLFLENPGLDAVRSSIQAVIEIGDDYLDSHVACDCLAACEVVARLQGKWGIRNEYTEDLDEWIEANPIGVPEDLKTAADSAIGRILSADSELLELWDEGGRNETWQESMDDLRKRIRG